MNPFKKRSSKKEANKRKKLAFLPLEERIVLDATGILSPTIDIAPSIAEGSSATLFGNFSFMTSGGSKDGEVLDPGGNPVFHPTISVSVNWGDDSDPTILTATNNLNGGTFRPSHAYTNEGRYNITATLTNTNDGTSTILTDTTFVNNAPLTATPLADSATLAGQTFTPAPLIFHDANMEESVTDFSAIIRWGDGTQSNGTVISTGDGNFTVLANEGHIYQTAGTHTLTFDIRDSGHNTTISTTSFASIVTVTPASFLQATGGFALSGIEGNALSQAVLATFTDSSGLNQNTVSINWGDNSALDYSAQIVDSGMRSAEGLIIYNVVANHTYTDTGNYLPSVIITDSNGMTSIVNDTITITNASLTAFQTSTLNLFQGLNFSGAVGSFINENANEPIADLAATIEWGDGIITSGTIQADPNTSGAFIVNGGHTYQLPGTYTRIVTFTDDDGGVVSLSGQVHVQDSLLATGGLSFIGAQGNSLNLQQTVIATFQAPAISGAQNLLQAVINWGDGSFSAAQIVDTGQQDPNSGLRIYQVYGNTHTYADVGARTLTVIISDLRTQQSEQVFDTVIVTNPPLVSSPFSISTPLYEDKSFSGPIAIFSDGNLLATPEDYTVSINWGDGSVSSGTLTALSEGYFNVDGTHTYQSGGDYTQTITITDAEGAVLNIANPLHITDIVLNPENFPVSTYEGAPLNTVWKIAIPQGDSLNHYSFTIKWGDGSSSSVTAIQDTLTQDPETGFEIYTLTQSHSYKDNGNYSIELTVKDNTDLTSQIATQDIVVSEAPLTLVSAVTNTNLEQGRSITIPLTFIDLNKLSIASDFQVTINWGDGTQSNGTLSGGNGFFTAIGTHTYDRVGFYVATATITEIDSNTSSTTNITTIVHPAPLQITSPPFSITNVESVHPNLISLATVTDGFNRMPFADSAYPIKGTIDWGDGSSSAAIIMSNGTDPQTGYTIYNVYGSHTYADAGQYTPVITINDTNGTVKVVTGSAQIENNPLSASGIPNSNIFLSQNLTPEFTFHNPNLLEPATDFTAIIHWGDGSTSAGTVTALGNGDFKVIANESHTYQNAGDYTLTFEIQDTAHNAPSSLTSFSSVVIVTADPLEVVGGFTFNGLQGNVLNLQQTVVATFQARAISGSETPLHAVINWGDGSSSVARIVDTGQKDPQSGLNVYSVYGETHTYTNTGVRIFTVIVSDTRSGQTEQVFNVVNIANPPLIPDSFNISTPIYEGRSFTGEIAAFRDGNLLASPNDYIVMINWGDGTAPSPGTITMLSNGYFRVNGTHTYQADGNYAQSISITEPDGFSLTINKSIQVSSSLIALNGGFSLNSMEGFASGSKVVARLQDTNSLSQLSATINWGDGKVSTGQIVRDTSSSNPDTYLILGDHTYAAPGNYTITVTAQDAFNNQATAASAAIIADAPLTEISGTTINPIGGQSFTTQVATFSDANPNTLASDFSATINWGDGTQSVGIIRLDSATGNFIVTGTHTYQSGGTYLESVKIVDIDGSQLTINDTVQTIKLWGINEKAQLFSIGNYKDPLNTTVDYGKIMYKAVQGTTTGQLRTLTHIDSFAVNSEGVAYIVVNQPLAKEGLPGGGRPVLLSIDLDNVVAGQANVAKVVGYLNTNSITAITVAPASSANPGALYALMNTGITNAPEQLITIDTDPTRITNGLIGINSLGLVTGSYNSYNIAVSNNDGQALKFDSSGNLYASDNRYDLLYRIDPTNGKILAIADYEPQQLFQNVEVTALAWDPTNHTMLNFNDENNSLGSLALGNGTDSTFITMSQKTMLKNLLDGVIGMDFYF